MRRGGARARRLYLRVASHAGAGAVHPRSGAGIQLSDLRALLADSKLATEEADKSDCADGFVYTLVTGATKLEWADCGTGMPPTAMRVVDLLSTSTPF
jgi:hypothetical protein